MIQRKASGPRAERLRLELAERLDGWDLEDEIGDRPVAEIIADLCRDLGIAHVEGTHPWKRRTPADIAALCERAARPPGSPAGTIPKSGSGDPSSAPRSGRAARHPVDGDSGETERDVRDLDDGALDGELEALVGELDEQERDDGGQDDAGRDDAEPGFPDPTGFGIGDPRKGAPDLPAARVPAPDMSDYEPGARAWLWSKQVLPGPAAPDTTRPSGRASFRGG